MSDPNTHPPGSARRRTPLFWVFITGTGFFVIGILLVAPLLFTPREILWAQTVSWDEFRSQNKETLAIPAEAQPVRWRSAGFFLSSYSKATFRLPTTRTPQAWLKHMARQTWLKEISSPNGLEYRARQGYYLRYLPDRSLYEAQWDTEWDGDDG